LETFQKRKAQTGAPGHDGEDEETGGVRG